MDLVPRVQEPTAIDYPEDYDPSLNGIGGLLVVVIIEEILSIILYIGSLIVNMAKIPLVNDTSPKLSPILTAETILFLFEIILSVMILVFIFTCNIRFRALFVISVLAGLIYYIIAAIYISNNSLVYSIGAPKFIGSVVLVSCLFNSKRINNTFIYPKLYPYRREEDKKDQE